MRTLLGSLLLLAPLGLAAAGGASADLEIRGRRQSVAFLPAASGKPRGAVLFLPGDGGWRGLAVTIAQSITQWSYDVYGFDTKAYLEGFGNGKAKLTRDAMAEDMLHVVAWVRSRGARRVVILGWSQGAGMALLAAKEKERGADGVVTLGLPESAVLGWNWKDTLAVAARRTPDEPAFAVEPLLPAVSPTPLAMIHGSEDEYTPPAVARRLHASAGEPKRLIEVDGANHRFGGKRDELFQALQEALSWVETARG